MASSSVFRQRRWSALMALLAVWLAESKQSKLVPMSTLLSGLRCEPGARAIVGGPIEGRGRRGRRLDQREVDRGAGRMLRSRSDIAEPHQRIFWQSREEALRGAVGAAIVHPFRHAA